MRYVSKVLIVVMGLISFGVLSSGVRADDLMIGSFKLPHPTAWKGMVLPAGDYTFKLSHTQTDVSLLSVRGSKQAMNVLIFARSACRTCRSSALTVAVNGDDRAVMSLDLPGYHVDFKSGWSKAEREQQSRKSATPSEQVAVTTNSN